MCGAVVPALRPQASDGVALIGYPAGQHAIGERDCGAVACLRVKAKYDDHYDLPPRATISSISRSIARIRPILGVPKPPDTVERRLVREFQLARQATPESIADDHTHRTGEQCKIKCLDQVSCDVFG